MPSLGDRMRRSGPIWKAIYERLNDLINGHNELVSIVFAQNPHKANDSTNLITADTAVDLDSTIDLEQDLITKFEAHLADTDAHLAADTANTVTELGVPIEAYTLLNEIVTDYEAHRILTTSSVHNSADTTNAVTASSATTKATAIALVNDVKAQLIAHYANDTAHTAADTTNPPTFDDLESDATWTEIVTDIDALRTSYEAHRVLTTGSVHGAADSTNTVSATAIGTITTALYAGLNELKTDFNAHITESGTYHYFQDLSMKVTTANATTEATALALSNALNTAYTDHISRAAEVAAGPLVSTLDEE